MFDDLVVRHYHLSTKQALCLYFHPEHTLAFIREQFTPGRNL